MRLWDTRMYETEGRESWKKSREVNLVELHGSKAALAGVNSSITVFGKRRKKIGEKRADQQGYIDENTSL